MNRRHFLQSLAALGVSVFPPLTVLAGLPANTALPDRLLILVELKGGNDGLNTVVPYGDPRYAALRPRIGLARDGILPLSEAMGLHTALEPLMPLWASGELGIVQGLGYPAPNLSHFRSIEIWDTASASDEFLAQGWLARAFAAVPPAPTLAADGAVIGSQDMGPLTGGRRIVAMSNADHFLRQSRLASAAEIGGSGALAHIRMVENEIRQAADKLSAGSGRVVATEFPNHAFGSTVRTAAQILASGAGVAAMRLTLSGFDTHQNQTGTHTGLLQQLASGLTSLRSALIELGLWQKALVMTYAEFGRRPKENDSRGTDHGTAAPHFVLGGRVKGGFHGAMPDLGHLDGNGNLRFTVDFRRYYATVLERWWQTDSTQALRGRYAPLDFLNT
jgi:uncharacterized protein (DUF1501 family)